MRIRAQTRMRATPETVMAVIADPALRARWYAPLAKVENGDWRLRVGARFDLRHALGKGTITTIEVIERERHRLVMSLEGACNGYETFIAAPDGKGAVVVYEFAPRDERANLALDAATWVARTAAARAQLKRLTKLVETPTTADAPSPLARLAANLTDKARAVANAAPPAHRQTLQRLFAKVRRG